MDQTMKQMSDQPVDWTKWVGGAVAGALLMYMLDPERGGQRRAASDQALRSLTRETGSMLGSAMRDVGGATGGMRGMASQLAGRAEELTERAGAAVARPNGAAGHAMPAALDSVRETARELGAGARDVARDVGASAS
ncbi:MAG: hypothetical protein ABIT83_21770, partial [Massilia sp.]